MPIAVIAWRVLGHGRRCHPWNSLDLVHTTFVPEVLLCLGLQLNLNDKDGRKSSAANDRSPAVIDDNAQFTKTACQV